MRDPASELAEAFQALSLLWLRLLSVGRGFLVFAGARCPDRPDGVIPRC